MINLINLREVFHYFPCLRALTLTPSPWRKMRAMSRMEVGGTQQAQQDSKKCSLSNEGDKGTFDILSSLSCHAVKKINIPEYIGDRKKTCRL